MTQHNRRSLDPSETTELDSTMSEYEEAREQARAAFLAAQSIYLDRVGRAADRRDDRILALVNAAGGRGTQARVVEYLGMNPSYLSLRLRNARVRATLDNIAGKLTTDYLAPALEAMGEDPTGYELAFDYTDVRANEGSATHQAKDPSG